MLYELFMFWVVGSISVVVTSMVLGGLLCVWCAYRGSKHTQWSSPNTRSTKPPINSLLPTKFKQPDPSLLPVVTTPHPPHRRHTRNSRAIY